MKITIGGLKGGLGKTTSAGFLATALAQRGRRVRTIDADPQSQSLWDWYSLLRDAGVDVPWECQPVAHASDLPRWARTWGSEADDLIIDTGGGTDAIFRAAVGVAPQLIIPTRPNKIEIRRIPATFEAAAETEAVSGVPVIPRILLVAVDSRAGDAAAARAFFASAAVGSDGEPIPLPVLEKQVAQSVMYSRGFATVPDDVGDYSPVLDELLVEFAVEAAA